MNTYDLGKRRTGNNLCKITNVKTKIVDGKKAICFYSSYDECGYVYPGYSVYDAVLAYEKDTRYQGFAEISYHTNDAFIAEEFTKMPPY